MLRVSRGLLLCLELSAQHRFGIVFSASAPMVEHERLKRRPHAACLITKPQNAMNGHAEMQPPPRPDPKAPDCSTVRIHSSA